MPKALDGVKVLDFTQYNAGPNCSMFLRELGAEVIKVEIPGRGDAERASMPLSKKREALQFICRNRGKKSITLNLKNEKGLGIATALAARADVLVENFAAGVMDRLGLSYEELTRINPRLIYASISGYGHTGPRSSEPSYDLVTQAMGGLMSITGFPDGPPTRVGAALGDYLGGLNTAVAILAALYYRSMTGEGQAIDISMQDGVWAFVLPERADYFVNNETPKRYGNRYSHVAPAGSYTATNGDFIIFIATENQWGSLLHIIGREDLTGDKRYATREGRTNHRDEVDALVEGWSKTRTVEEILDALKKAKVPCSPVPTFDEVAHDPQLLSRGMIVEVEQPISGKVKLTGSVLKMSKTPGDKRFPAPALGEHNHEIYSGMLGYSREEIQKLKEEGVI